MGGKGGKKKAFKSQTEPWNNAAGASAQLGCRAEGATKLSKKKFEKKTKSKMNTSCQLSQTALCHNIMFQVNNSEKDALDTETANVTPSRGGVRCDHGDCRGTEFDQ